MFCTRKEAEEVEWKYEAEEEEKVTAKQKKGKAKPKPKSKNKLTRRNSMRSKYGKKWKREKRLVVLLLVKRVKSQYKDPFRVKNKPPVLHQNFRLLDVGQEFLQSQIFPAVITFCFFFFCLLILFSFVLFLQASTFLYIFCLQPSNMCPKSQNLF